MKVFISQLMNGITNEEIKKERELIANYLRDKEKLTNFEVIDSFFENAPHDAKPLWYLGESLKLMGEADLVVFAPNWDKGRGCVIEYDAAYAYGLKTLTLSKKDLNYE